MTQPTVATRDRAVQTSLAILQRLFAEYHPRDFTVRFWDGTTWEADEGHPARFTLILRHPGALRSMLMPPGERTLGEAYIYDDFDVEGEIERAFAMGDHLLGKTPRFSEKVRLAKLLRSLPLRRTARIGRQPARLAGRVHSIDRDRQAVTYHYDVPGEFFALWLDRNMVYSCAYFASHDEDLDSAQERKLEYICRKLRLKPGERVLDIGCGWGGFVIYAAKNFGASATGITLSKPQAELARERIRREGLEERCQVRTADYRELDEPEAYDKVVSIGMVEHVGAALLPEYFSRAWQLLRPGGVFLNHGIAYPPEQTRHRGSSFSQAFVFPDGEPVAIGASTLAAERAGFEVRDVESLREHYALTLRQWVRRLEAHRDEAIRITDEATYRTWRLFMSYSAYSFAAGRYNVYQSLLLKASNGISGLPLSRADWYH